MPSPHPAVTPEAIEIAKKYGKNVSRGIVEMEKIIMKQKKDIVLIGTSEFRRTRTI